MNSIKLKMEREKCKGQQKNIWHNTYSAQSIEEKAKQPISINLCSGIRNIKRKNITIDVTMGVDYI
jgi:hypothetical protein